MFDDKKADSLSAPQPGTKQPAANAAANEIPATRWRDWFTGVAQVHNAATESDTKFREESSAGKAPVNYFGSEQPVRDDDGQIKQRLASGTVQREDARGVFSWLQGLFTSRKDGEEKYGTDAKHRPTTEWSKDEKTIGLGGVSATTSGGTKIEIVDVTATGAVVQKQLEDEITTQQAALERLQADKAKLVKVQQRTQQTDPDAAALDAQIQATTARIAAAQAAITTIKADPTNPSKLKKVCAKLGIYVEPTMKVVSEDSVTTTEKLTREGWKLTSSDGTTIKDTTQDASGARTINTTSASTSQSLDLSEGKATRVVATSQSAQKSDGSSTTTSRSSTESTAVGGGAFTYANSNTSGTTTKNSKGEVESGTSKTYSGEVSMVGGDDGVGARGGGSASSSTTQGEDTSTNTASGHAGMTDKGVLGDVGLGHKHEGKKVEREIKASADGAILIEVQPPEDGSTTWHVVTTIRAGIKLDASLGTKKPEDAAADEGGTKGSGSLGGNAGATMTYSHAMTQDQAVAYMSAADKAEASTAASGGGTYPEFDAIEKLNLIVHGDANANPTSVLGSSASAAAIKPGDSVSLVLTAGVQGKLSGAAGSKDNGGAGVDVSASGSYTRTLKIARDPDGTVVVTLGFVAADKLEGSVSGNLEGASAKVGGSHDASDGEEYAFKLDPKQPDYEGCYSAIVGSMTREAIKSLYSDPMMKSHADKRKLTDQQTNGTSVEMGAGGATFTTGHETQQSKAIEVSNQGATGTESGGASDSAKLTAVGSYKETGSISSSVDASGQMTSDLQDKQETSPGMMDRLHDLGKNVKSWFVKDDKPPTTRDAIKGAVAKTPGERVKELLDKQYTRLSGYKLSSSDVDALIARAADQTNWMHAVISPRVLEPWRQLEGDLLQPDIDMSLVPDPTDELQLQKATKLAQAHALARFMEQTGTKGYETIVRVMREYGATLNRESTAGDLGTRYEWPESLSKYRVLYDTAAATADQIPQLFTDLVGKPDGAQKWHAMSDKQIKALDTVHAAIAENKDIRSERARAEMLDACSLKKAQFIATAGYFDRATATQATADPKAAASSASDTEASEAEVGARMFAQARIPGLVTDLTGFKLTERALFKPYKDARGRVSRDAISAMSQVRDLYELWVSKIQELRKQYAVAKVPPDQWQVSSGPDDARREGTEPDVDTMIHIYQQAGGDDYNTKAFEVDWKQRWTRY